MPLEPEVNTEFYTLLGYTGKYSYLNYLYELVPSPTSPHQVSPLEETVLHGFNTEHLYSVPHLTMDSHVPCPQVKLETVDPKTCK